MVSNEKKIILFTFVAHFLFHFYEIAFPALAIPLMLSLNMDLRDVLVLGFPMYLTFGLFSLPWGIFADRYSCRKALIVCYCGGGIGALMTALSSSTPSMTWSLAVVGAFACICHPAGMGLISHGVRNRGTALGINSIAGSIGLAVGPFIAGLINWLSDWRMVYLSAAVFSIACGLALFMTPIDETPIIEEHNSLRTNQRFSKKHILNILLFFAILTLGGLAYRVNIVILPAYFEFNAHFLYDLFRNVHLPNLVSATSVAAAVLVSGVYAIGIFGQLTGGRFADRYDLRSLYLYFNILSLPFVIMMAYFSEQSLVLVSAAYVSFALGIQPIENSLVAKFTPQRWRSTGYGISAVLIFGVGSVTVYLVGWIKDGWSLGASYLFSAAVILLIISGILLLMRNTRGQDFRNRQH
jgi:FSR family fosmidomycin resistance protein-like MFS transporter